MWPTHGLTGEAYATCCHAYAMLLGLVNLQDQMLVDGQPRVGESARQMARKFHSLHCFILHYFHIRQETSCMGNKIS